MVDDADTWLNGRPVVCGSCGERLYRVDHSPFYDSYFLYCDRCPRRVEVGMYDPVYQQIQDDLRERGAVRYGELMARLAARLRPCDCGGRYRDDAPRRCFRCGAELDGIVPASGVDLWPAWPDDEPTDLDLQEQQAFEARFIRTTDLWEATGR